MVASSFRTGMRTDTDGKGIAVVDCGMRIGLSFMSRDFNGIDPAATGSIQFITRCHGRCGSLCRYRAEPWTNRPRLGSKRFTEGAPSASTALPRDAQLTQAISCRPRASRTIVRSRFARPPTGVGRRSATVWRKAAGKAFGSCGNCHSLCVHHRKQATHKWCSPAAATSRHTNAPRASRSGETRMGREGTGMLICVLSKGTPLPRGYRNRRPPASR